MFADLVNKLIRKGKQLLAIRFIFEFGLADKFPPVPLLKTYVKESKKTAKKVCKEGKYSLKSQVIFHSFKRKLMEFEVNFFACSQCIH